jgi:hypothetical protein
MAPEVRAPQNQERRSGLAGRGSALRRCDGRSDGASNTPRNTGRQPDAGSVLRRSGTHCAGASPYESIRVAPGRWIRSSSGTCTKSPRDEDPGRLSRCVRSGPHIVRVDADYAAEPVEFMRHRRGTGAPRSWRLYAGILCTRAAQSRSMCRRLWHDHDVSLSEGRLLFFSKCGSEYDTLYVTYT